MLLRLHFKDAFDEERIVAEISDSVVFVDVIVLKAEQKTVLLLTLAFSDSC